MMVRSWVIEAAAASFGGLYFVLDKFYMSH